VEQDDGVRAAVYDLSLETYVGIVIRSRVSQAPASQVIGSVFLENIVLADEDLLGHKPVAIEMQRRHLVKALRCEEVPPGFWARAGIDQITGLPHYCGFAI
jgi:hypothetical protein